MRATIDESSLIERILSKQETRVSNGGIARTLGVNPSTSYRWMTSGVVTPVGRIRLESAAIGGRRITTLEAVQRFTDAVAAARNGMTDETAAPALRSPSARQRESEAAAKQLETLGI